MNPCDDYPTGQCPSIISLGQSGKVDIVPLRTLLRAAGIQSLDQAGEGVACRMCLFVWGVASQPCGCAHSRVSVCVQRAT